MRLLRSLGMSWRLNILFAVFVLGVIALSSGVGVSDRKGVADAMLATKLYYVLGLFVLGGLDLGVPEGGPAWGRALLWFVYFTAPAITTSALVEGLLLLIRPHIWWLRPLRNHVIIAGCGRLALLYLQRLREVDPHRRVLVVERRTDSPNAAVATQRYQAILVFGDISSDHMLESLRLKQAGRIVLLTGDDYANLDAAARATRLAPHLESRTIVHVSDIRLLRIIEQNGILSRVAKFNTYRTAASHLVQERMLPQFKSTEHLDTVVLAGFGRFGQTVLAELQDQAQGCFDRVVIVDHDAKMGGMVFREQIGFAEQYELSTVDGDVRHPTTWEKIRSKLGENPVHPVFVLGTGDDGVNVRSALSLSASDPGAKIFARCFERSAFTDQISRQCGFEIVSTAELLLASIHENWVSAPHLASRSAAEGSPEARNTTSQGRSD